MAFFHPFDQTVQEHVGIKAVTLQIVPFPTELLDAGVSHKRIENHWRGRLERAGITISDEPSVPSLLLGVSYFADDETPGTAAVLATLFLKQSAHFQRLDRALQVPTYIATMHVMGRDETIARKFHREIEKMVDTVVQRIRDANEHEEELTLWRGE